MAFISEEILTLDDLENVLMCIREKGSIQNIPLDSDDPLILLLLEPGELDSCLARALDGETGTLAEGERRACLLPMSQAEHLIELLEETDKQEGESSL